MGQSQLLVKSPFNSPFVLLQIPMFGSSFDRRPGNLRKVQSVEFQGLGRLELSDASQPSRCGVDHWINWINRAVNRAKWEKKRSYHESSYVGYVGYVMWVLLGVDDMSHRTFFRDVEY